MADMVNHPPHYKKGRFETIDVIEDICQHFPSVMAHNVGCVIKYISRSPHKGAPIEDLKKARWYLERLISQMENFHDQKS